MMNAFTRRFSLDRPRPPPPPPTFSESSTPGVPDSAWCSNDFMLGAGMVIIQPSTDKVLLVYEESKNYWFLPKGRKDIGESLEEAALREAYEESGYRVEFLPLHMPSNAPLPPGLPREHYMHRKTEPIYITTHRWSPLRRKRKGDMDYGGEYITSYYVGQIPADAIHEDNTGMPDERHYTSHLMSIDEALARLAPPEKWVVYYAWKLWTHTMEIEREREETER